MKLNVKQKSNILVLIQAVFIIAWLSNLAHTDAYFSVYALCALGSVFCICDNYYVRPVNKLNHIGLLCFLSATFSIITLAANYSLFSQSRDLEIIAHSTNQLLNLLNIVCSLVGGSFVAFNILSWISVRVPLDCSVKPRLSESKKSLIFILGIFLSIVFINLVHLLLVEYPGNATQDSINQMDQIYTQEYTNRHPFWHTILLKIIMSAGYTLFGSSNAAVAFYCVFQIIVIAACFTYGLFTLYQAGIPKLFVILSYAVYALLPYNIAFSITIWKDVLFGISTLLIVASMYRIMNKLGNNQILNYIVFAIGGIVFCLSRTNGWPVYLVCLLIFTVFLVKNYKKLLITMASVFVFCWILTNPIVSALTVSGTDYTEALSIPLQQISRVIADGHELTEEETALISEILDIEEVPELYTSWLSDPIKIEMKSNNTEYFEENITEYIKLWGKLGLKYPDEYFKAWVDQTKGYWNGGYDYAQYSETVTKNNYSIAKADSNNIIAKLSNIYFGFSRHSVFFEPLHSIGLHVWLAVLCCVFNAVKKRKEFLLSLPALIVIIGLWLGTPVYSSFRYAYPLFTSFPLILAFTLYHSDREHEL